MTKEKDFFLSLSLHLRLTLYILLFFSYNIVCTIDLFTDTAAILN